MAESAKSVYGHLDRHNYEDRNVRLHVYASKVAADADVSSATARMIFVQNEDRAYWGRSGAWIPMVDNTVTSTVTDPGQLPVGTHVTGGSILSVNYTTGAFTLTPGTVPPSVSVGDTFIVLGSQDALAAPWLDKAYAISAVDVSTNKVSVDPAALPPLVNAPVATYGSGSYFVGAPADGTLRVVNPDPATAGPVIWLFERLLNTWVRANDADPRVILADGSHPFTAFPTVHGTAAPTTDRALTTKDYVDAQRGVAEAYADGAVAAHDLAFDHTSFQSASQVKAIIHSDHELETTIGTVTISGIVGNVATASTLPPAGATGGQTLRLSDGKRYTILSVVGADITLTTAPSPATTGLATVLNGFDHNQIATVSTGLAAHIADAGDPHAAAGYLKTTIASATFATPGNISVHNSDPAAHGGILGTVQGIINNLREVESIKDAAAVVDLGAASYEYGMPVSLEPVTKVYHAVVDASVRPVGLLVSYADPILQTFGYSVTFGTNYITLNDLSTPMSAFQGGSGYKWSGGTTLSVSYQDAANRRVYFTGSTGALNGTTTTGNYTEFFPTSLVIQKGRYTIPNGIQRFINGVFAAARRVSNVPEIFIGNTQAISGVRVGDTITIAGHLSTPGKNGTNVVTGIDTVNNALKIQTTVGVFVPDNKTGAAASWSTTAASKVLAPDAWTSFYNFRVGQQLSIAGPGGSANIGTYILAAFNETAQTITVDRPLPETRTAVETGNITFTDPIAPDWGVANQDFTGLVVGGLVKPNIHGIQNIGGGQYQVDYMPGTVPIGTSLRLVMSFGVPSVAVTVVSAVAGHAIINAADVTPSYLCGTGPGSKGLYGIAQFDGQGFANITSVTVSTKTVVVGSALYAAADVGDTLLLEGTGSDGSYTIQSKSAGNLVMAETMLGSNSGAVGDATLYKRGDGTIAVTAPLDTNAFLTTPTTGPQPIYSKTSAPYYEVAPTTPTGWVLGQQISDAEFFVDINGSYVSPGAPGATVSVDGTLWLQYSP